MSKEATARSAMKLALEAAYLAGWNASGEGYNAEYPFGDRARNPEEDAAWIKDRDNALREALAEQPAQQEPVIAQNGDTLEIETILYTSPQPAQQDIPDLIAGALGVSRGTAYDMMREALAEQPAQQEQEQEPICKLFGTLPVYDRAAQQEPVAFGALAKRRVFDYIRGAYDLGYNDARQARTIPGDGAPGYKGRDVEADHGGALLHALESITPPPAQRKPLPYNKDDMDGLDINQRLGFKLGWKAAEEAHGIKENT